MEVYLGEATLNLNEDQPIKIRGAMGALMTCMDGVLWLTQEGDARDWHLCAGQVHRIETDGVVLVEGAPRGSLRVTV